MDRLTTEYLTIGLNSSRYPVSSLTSPLLIADWTLSTVARESVPLDIDHRLERLLMLPETTLRTKLATSRTPLPMPRKRPPHQKRTFRNRQDTLDVNC